MVCVGVGLGVSASQVTLEWDPPIGNFEILSYGVWHATNEAGPWVKITNSVTTNVVVGLPVGMHSFFVTASNSWGESEPSNVVTTETKAQLSVRPGESRELVAPWVTEQGQLLPTPPGLVPSSVRFHTANSEVVEILQVTRDGQEVAVAIGLSPGRTKIVAWGAFEPDPARPRPAPLAPFLELEVVVLEEGLVPIILEDRLNR
jgi:hypothetical protein